MRFGQLSLTRRRRDEQVYPTDRFVELVVLLMGGVLYAQTFPTAAYWPRTATTPAIRSTATVPATSRLATVTGRHTFATDTWLTSP